MAIQSDQVRLTVLTVSEEAAKSLGCDAGPLTAKRMQAILMNEQAIGVLQKLAQPSSVRQASTQLAAL